MHMVFLILASVALLVLAGTVYQHLGSLRDRRIHTLDGRWVSIGSGCRLYAFEEGKGEATVLFESGIGATHLNWRGIQDSIATLAHTVSYDRAGLGWSGPSQSPRTPGNIAAELHQMLEAAGLKPPYVLVGHSFGGVVMRRFALLYPEEVSGVVLVDPMRSEEWPPLNPSRQSQLDLGNRLIRCALPVVRCGLARLLVTSLFGRPGNLSDHIAGAAGANPRHVLARIKTEVRKMPQGMARCRRALVAAKLLLGAAQPHRFHPRHRERNAHGRTHSRHSRHRAHAGKRRSDRKSTRLNSSHMPVSRMPSSA